MIFGENFKMSKEEITGQKLGLRRSEGHLYRGEVLRRSKGCLAAARPRAKKATPRVRCSVAVLRRSEALHRFSTEKGTVNKGKIFRILFQKPCIRTPIV